MPDSKNSNAPREVASYLVHALAPEPQEAAQ
jgi:hypothetical protein